MANDLAVSISADTANLRSAVAAAQDALRGFGAEAQTMGATATAAGSAADAGLRGALDGAADAAGRAQADVAKLGTETANLGKGAEAGFGQLGRGLDSIQGKLGSLSGLAGGFKTVHEAAKQAYEIVAHFGEVGEGLAQLHQATSLSIEDLSALRVVVSEAGGDLASVQPAVARLGQSMREALETPGSAAGKAFQTLGIELRDASGAAIPMSVAVERVSRALAEQGGSTEAVIATTTILGEQIKGPLLAALTDLGEQGFEGARGKAAALDQLWSGESVKSAEEFEHSVRDLRLELEGLGKAALVDTGLISTISGAIQNVARGTRYLFSPDLEAQAARLSDQIDDLKANLAQQQDDVVDKYLLGGTFAAGIQRRIDERQKQFDAIVAKIRASRAPQPVDDGLSPIEVTGKRIEESIVPASPPSAPAAAQAAAPTPAPGRASSEGQAAASKLAETQLKALEEVTAAAERGSEERIAATRKEVDFTASAWGRGSDQYIAAQRRLQQARDAYAEHEAAIAAKIAQDQIAASGRAEAAELAQVEKGRRAGELSVDAARAAEAEIVRAHEDAALRILTSEYLGAEEGSAAQEKYAREIEALTRESADKLVALNDRAAEEVAAEWRRVNERIGHDFSALIMGALSNHRNGFRAQVKRIADGMLGDLFSTIGSSLAQQVETHLLGIGGESPGGLLGGLVSKVIGSDAAGFLGLAPKAADVGKDAALTANTLALRTLNTTLGGHATATATQTSATVTNTGAQTTNSAAQSVNTGATTVNSGAQATTAAAQAVNTASTDLNSATQESGIAAWVANTIATLANTIATDAAAIGHFLGFASGGRPPVGVPSIVGERGPELWVPDGAGTILPNGSWGPRSFGSGVSAALSALGGGSGDTTIHAPLTINGGGRLSDQDVDHLLSAHGGRIVRHVVNELRNRGLKLARA
jgi:hypothetical protein